MAKDYESNRFVNFTKRKSYNSLKDGWRTARCENLVHLNVRFSTETELKKIQDFLYGGVQGLSFTGLVEAMANEVTIVTAVHNIKSNKGSRTAGVDKIKMDKYLQMPKDELILLIQSSFRNYHPNQPAVNISKRVTARKDRWVSPLYWTGSYRSACVSLSSRSVKRDFIRKATAFAPIGHRNTQSGVSSMS